jgi:hypothetical protein
MSPKRGSLAGMLTPPPAVPPMPARAPDSQTPDHQAPGGETPEVQTPVQQTPEVQSHRVRRPARPAPAPMPPPSHPGLPKYRRLERKELLIWPDQITQLSIQARVLNRTRGGAGERITVNTLIRVFIAAGLARAGELAGTTEEELRRSLGLPE